MDRATDIAAPGNMDAETLQVPDSAPTPQKDKGQRGVEAAPQFRKSGYSKLQRTQRANDHICRGGDGRCVMTIPTALGRAGGHVGDTSRAATSEAAARQGEWTAQQTTWTLKGTHCSGVQVGKVV